MSSSAKPRATMGINMVSNEYADELGELYGKMPKAVLAAVAVSYASDGGDHMEHIQTKILTEWHALYDAGIVKQKPPKGGA